MNYVPSRVASKQLGLHPNTLRRYADQGKIKHIKTESGQRRYNVADIIKDSSTPYKRKICYCRVSSKKQLEDLKRQVAFLKKSYPRYEFIEDYGSGINFNRKGLRKILELSNNGYVEEIVVTYKDRLARVAYELVEFFITLNGGKIVVLNDKPVSKQEEFIEDVFSIIHVFSSKHYGSRNYKNKEGKNLPKTSETKKENKNAPNGSSKSKENIK